ncbi:hypothetical protein DPMN_079259 [Dreissena polymorpha]|uniref:Uncharacterized protein n=1 Tax=Dreissena polymorpha TaxID=45954 RepID=A0A9D3YU55_DREPO|nr:hypothetical protein DPMN_079259 [Dreissena polymorpha]
MSNLSSGNHLVDGRIDRPTYRHIQLLTKFGEPGGVNYGKKYQPGLLDEGINQKFHGFNQHLGDQGVYQDQHGESTGLPSWVNYSGSQGNKGINQFHKTKRVTFSSQAALSCGNFFGSP